MRMPYRQPETPGSAPYRSDPASSPESERTRFHFFSGGFITPKLRNSAIPETGPPQGVSLPEVRSAGSEEGTGGCQGCG